MASPIMIRNKEYKRVQLTCEGKGRTKQSMRDECDINFLMAKYQKSGQMPTTNPFPPHFGDFSEIDDYQGSLNQVIEAQAGFDGLPSKIRTRFGNDPAELLSFLADPENLEEAVELGLLEAPPEPVAETPQNTEPEPPAPPEKGGGDPESTS